MSSPARVTRLDRLETLYLNILRVSIIVLATVLLVASALGLIYAAPKLIPSFGSSNPRELVSADRLQDYINETRPNEASVAPTSAEDAAAAQVTKRIDGRISTAAKTLVAWRARAGERLPLVQVQMALDQRQKALTDALQGDYADSLVKFSRDLAGRQPGNYELEPLIEWHHARFTAAEAAATAQDAARAERTLLQRQQAMLLAGAAMTGFLIFLILLFVFVLVKIERNLRLVRVADETSSAPTPAPAGS